jgi:protocatechuate 3,4-dioxygenase beta subunit
MCFSPRYLPAVLLTLLSLAASLCAQSTTKQAARVPRGLVSGRVTIKDKGAPGVAVGLHKGGDAINPGEPYSRTITDHDGFYRFANLAPGSYSITPSAPAFVMANTREARAKSVLVGEDENVEGINFALVRGGVITGRVTDAEGRPVVEQQVNIYSTELLEQKSPDRPIFTTKSAQTDDRGIYRIFGLSAGRYKVSAGRTEDLFNPTLSQDSHIYKQVFHPDVTDHAKANVLEVTEGSEANNIDISLGRALQTYSVSGLVIDEKGLPVPNLRISVQRRVGQRIEYVMSNSSSSSRGEFVVEGLIPGKYGVFLSPNQAGGDMRAEPVSFDIIDQDVGGLTVKLTKGASLTGFVLLENDDKAIFKKLSELQLRALSMASSGGGNFASSAMTPIGPDGSFRLAGLPGGTINLMLAAVMNPFEPKGFTITRVERDGIVSSSRLEIKDGEQLTGVRVIISFGDATIRGVVKLENGSLPEGGRIILRVSKRGETLPNFRGATVDARGHFLVDGLAAGTYELAASVTTGTPSMRTVKNEVTVADGQVTEVTITIDMNASVKP